MKQITRLMCWSLLACLGCSAQDDGASGVEPPANVGGYDCNTICRAPAACLQDPETYYQACITDCTDRSRVDAECLDIWVMYARCASTAQIDCSTLVPIGCEDRSYGFIACGVPKVRSECMDACGNVSGVDEKQSCLNTCYMANGRCVIGGDTNLTYCQDECINFGYISCNW